MVNILPPPTVVSVTCLVSGTQREPVFLEQDTEPDREPLLQDRMLTQD